MQPRVATVVPVVDEAEALRRLLPTLVGVADEIVVVDGGSSDGSGEVARALGARVVQEAPGRGRQLNRGARECDSEGLLFLHADTLLPSGAIDDVRRCLAAGFVGGAFLIRFDNPRLLYRAGEWMVNARTRLLQVPLGDQAPFASRERFDQIGGFREWPILEDLDFIRRLRRTGRLSIVRKAVLTSARRFERHGILRTVARNWLILILYAVGVRPQRLARLNRDDP